MLYPARPARRAILLMILGLVTGALGACGDRDASSPSARDSGHPVLLVIAPGESTSASLWEAILVERFGACDLVSGEALPALLARGLPGREVLVLTHAFLSSTDSSEAAPLVPILEMGLIALLDRPVDGWEGAAGLRTIGRADVPRRWPESRWSIRDSGDAALPGSPALEDLGSPEFPRAGKSQGTLEYLVQRPQVHGVRNVGAPLDQPTVWWKPEGLGGWLSVSLPLAELVGELQSSPDLDERERDLWCSALLESTLDPDVFANPLPRVWPRPTPAAPQRGRAEELALARAQLLWSFEAEADGWYRIDMQGGASGGLVEIALPLEWRGQILSDWDGNWPGASSRRIQGPRRAWRLLSAPQGEGVLRVHYRPAPGSARWR